MLASQTLYSNTTTATFILHSLSPREATENRIAHKGVNVSGKGAIHAVLADLVVVDVDSVLSLPHQTSRLVRQTFHTDAIAEVPVRDVKVGFVDTARDRAKCPSVHGRTGVAILHAQFGIDVDKQLLDYLHSTLVLGDEQFSQRPTGLTDLHDHLQFLWLCVLEDSMPCVLVKHFKAITGFRAFYTVSNGNAMGYLAPIVTQSL